MPEEDVDELAELVSGDTSIAEEIIEGAKEYVEALREMTRSNYGEEDGGAGELQVDEEESSETDGAQEAEADEQGN